MIQFKYYHFDKFYNLGEANLQKHGIENYHKPYNMYLNNKYLLKIDIGKILIFILF